MDISGALGEYIKEINSKLGVGDCSELTHRPEIEKLFKDCFAGCQVIGEQKKIDSGKPDFTIIQDKIPIGFVETKDIGIDLNKTEGSNQLKRYYEGIGNVIVTDYIEFRLYSKIAEEAPNSVPKPVLDPVVIATQDKSGEYKLLPDVSQKLSMLLNAFVENSDKVKPAGNPKELTVRLASIAKIIRDAVLGYLEKEDEEAKESGKKDPKDFGPYHSQLEAFKKELIGDITPAQFADMYAQTICYGMLAAKYHSESTNKGNISDETASRRIPKTNPFLVKVFDTIAGVDVDEKLGKWINVIAKLLNRANITEILAPKKSAFEGHDPIFYFYENFLAEYDPTLREKRGVYYTPLPVVSFIVRSVDKVLKQDFGLKDGLACDAKIDEQNHKVLILDPATGTGTFLNEVLEQIYGHFKQKGLTGIKWGNEYIETHILPRLFGFELMMAPYTMAHLKLGINLEAKNYKFNENKRLNVYLTNTLEEAKEKTEQYSLYEKTGFLKVLANESLESSDIKRDTPIMIVIGNPPYSGHSENKNEWISKLLKGMDIHAPNYNINGKEINTDSYFMVDGNDLGERNPKWLNDDYVKFIRFSQWRIQNTGYGVLAFITNHGYLDNPTFRGMRQSLMKTFDKIYVLDLHGNSKKKESAPDGGKDENVFDIQQGVAIGIFIKDGSREKIQDSTNLNQYNEKNQTPQPPGRGTEGKGKDDGTFGASVYHADLYGHREGSQDGKYERLLSADIETTHWQKLHPQKPFYLFVPQNTDLLAEYNTHPKITEILPVNVLGFQTHRDEFLIDFESNSLKKRIEDFCNLEIENSFLLEKYNLNPNKDWDLSETRKTILSDNNRKNQFIKCLYRPFDIRFCFFNTSLVDRPRKEFNDNILSNENLCLLSSRQQAVVGYRHCFVSKLVAESCVVSTTSREGNQVFPLYLYPNPNKLKNEQDQSFVASGGKDGRRPNLSPEVVKGLEARLCARFVPDGKGNITKNQTPQPPLKKGGLDSGASSDPLKEGGLDEGALTFGPEDIFNYIYAILHSPTYRTRYAEFLKIDFPRIPFTSNTALFAKLALIGEKLVGLHLLEDADYEGIGFPELGDNKVEKLAYNEQKGEVWINSKQYFSGIAQNVWEFHIGGYQVAQKWLKDRKGRTLAFEDIETYMKAMASIRETIDLMRTIDETIETFGGYPIS
jgi:type I restriction-modification system DNA methylase subunit